QKPKPTEPARWSGRSAGRSRRPSRAAGRPGSARSADSRRERPREETPGAGRSARWPRRSGSALIPLPGFGNEQRREALLCFAMTFTGAAAPSLHFEDVSSLQVVNGSEDGPSIVLRDGVIEVHRPAGGVGA